MQPITASELHTIVLRTRKLLAEQEKAWHDALVRECGFEVGMKVRATCANGLEEDGKISSVLFDYEDAEVYARVVLSGEAEAYAFSLTDLQRIDQDGNPLPERTASK